MNHINIPALLSEIPDKPKQLYIKGTLPDEEKNIFISIVGSRKYSSYGKQVCENLIKDLAGYPIVIISGLALGIDSIAHEAALRHNMTTVAIPGSGLDSSVLYPKSNHGLAQRILQNGGALVSEYEPNQAAAPWTFPKRNRIMAGMSHAIIVIEAEEKSGTRITARLATEYNRDVFSVPGSVFSKTSDGANALIKEGAYPITSAQDIIEHYKLQKKNEPTQQSYLPETPEEELLWSLLETPQSRNELMNKTNLPMFKINIVLSGMEIKGLVTEYLGNIQRR